MSKGMIILFGFGFLLARAGLSQSVTVEDHTFFCDSFNICSIEDGAVIFVSGEITLTGDCSKQKSVNISCAAGTKLTIHNINLYPYSQSAPALWFEGGTDNQLYISGDNTLRGDSRYAAISVANNATLTMDGKKNSFLTAYSTDNSAAIGGGYSSTDTCGTIIIDGGNITATGTWGAGIGAGGYGYCKSVIINDGKISATSVSAAGIGAGYCSGCGTISINGGHISATANSFGAGIGGGNRTEAICGSIEINGGNISAASSWGAGVGAGYYSCCERIEINNGKITASGTSGCVGVGRAQSGKETSGSLIINGGTIISNSNILSPAGKLPLKDESSGSAMLYNSRW